MCRVCRVCRSVREHTELDEKTSDWQGGGHASLEKGLGLPRAEEGRASAQPSASGSAAKDGDVRIC